MDRCLLPPPPAASNCATACSTDRKGSGGFVGTDVDEWLPTTLVLGVDGIVDEVEEVVRALEDEEDGRKWKEEEVLPGR